MRASCSTLLTVALAGCAVTTNTGSMNGYGEGERPHTKPPQNMTDCHMHIIDPRYPTSRPVKAALLSEYRKLKDRLGIKRNVIVQASFHGTDNRTILDTMAQIGNSARGIVDVRENVTDAELKQMDAAGVRGVRFNVRRGDSQAMGRIEYMSKRIHEYGWHTEMNINPEGTVAAKDIFKRLTAPVVFAHMGHLVRTGWNHPAREIIEELLQKERAWVKLSGFYLGSTVGLPSLADSGVIANAFLKMAPDRLVWGSDWPHVTAPVPQDDARLFDLFAQWVPDETTRRKILVDNPARLYRF